MTELVCRFTNEQQQQAQQAQVGRDADAECYLFFFSKRRAQKSLMKLIFKIAWDMATATRFGIIILLFALVIFSLFEMIKILGNRNVLSIIIILCFFYFFICVLLT